jgi:exonuclease SbcC
MIELVNIELTNFRAFGHGAFAPLGMGQGMTAINGSNGSGKSSLVHGLVWALYGITPDGVPVKALRRQGSEGEVRASVTFRHDGQTIVVSRALRGRNDSTVAAITVDGLEQTSVSTKTATAWVVNRLGLDSEAFLIAFVVRQKELDNLIKARPAERRKTIERLAGIQRMSDALDLARVNAKQSQRVLEALPESDDPEVAREHHQLCIASLKDAESEIETLQEKESVAQSKLQESQNEFNQAQRTFGAKESIKHRFDLAEQETSTLRREVERLSGEASGAESLAEAIQNAEDARKAYALAEHAVRDVEAVVNKAKDDADRALMAKKENENAQESLKRYKDQESEATRELGSLPADLDSQIEELTTESKNLTQRKGAVRGEWDRLTKALTTLKKSSADQAECPTCLRALDDVPLLISSLEQSLATAQTQGEALASEINSLESRITSLVTIQGQRNKLLAKQSASRQGLTTAEDVAMKTAEKEKTLLTIAEESRAKANQAQELAQSASDSLPELMSSERTTQALLRKAESAAQAATLLPVAQEKLESSLRVFETVQDELDIATGLANTLDIEMLENRVSEASEERNLIVQQGLIAKASLTSTSAAVEQALTALNRAESAALTRKNAFSEWEQHSAVALALDEFRRDRLARLAPELSEVASDLISRMTDGKYTAIELDEDFTPILTESNGTQRPSAWLSGGEESAVALALRVAIGEVLAGQRGGLLILDEVLTAQDQFRRQATMAAIRALPRQIITINHVSEATDMVDLVAEVIDDGEGASTIVDSAPGDSLGSDISDETLDTAV